MNSNLSNFVCFILSNRRPDKLKTYTSLRTHGYTGPIVIVIDDLDPTKDEYLKRYGDKVFVFNKENSSKDFDVGDNLDGYRGVVYARNKCFDIAKELGFESFVELDDDYITYQWRFNHEFNYIEAGNKIKNLDAIFDSMIGFLKSTNALTITMSQGGDFIGGKYGTMADNVWGKRKAMNSFFCLTDRPFKFTGRINEDVNAYINYGVIGDIMLMTNQVSLEQVTTQKNSGGMTELYLDSGTYVKSFYSVLYQPSCVKISILKDTFSRIHHRISWNNTTPKILDERHKHEIPKTVIKPKTILDKIQDSDLVELIKQSVCGADPEIAIATVKEVMKSDDLSKNNQVKILLDKWYGSLENGTPDYSVYADPYYVCDLWSCWRQYSRKALMEMNNHKTMNGKSFVEYSGDVKRVLDVGCGIAFTTAGLKELYPNAEVIGTNIRNTWQFDYGLQLGKKYGFTVKENKDVTGQFDIVVTSEYFEHLTNPIDELEEIVSKYSPKFMVIANGFNGTAIGHFNSYCYKGEMIPAKEMAKIFWKELKALGYEKLETKIWNNRPSIWQSRISAV